MYLDGVLERNIKILTVYASTKNWNRSKEEVKYLMTLMNKAFSEELDELNKLGFKINIIGSRDRISKTIKKNIEKIENETKNNKKSNIKYTVLIMEEDLK